MSPPLGYAAFVVPPPPPPLPLGRLWLWFTIAVTTAGISIAAASVVLLALWGSRDYPDLIDSDQVVKVIDAECGRMTQAVNDLAPRGSRHQVAQDIAAQDIAVQKMLDHVSGLGNKVLRSDRPTEAWIRDWQRFIDAREVVARRLIAGRDPDLPPLNDGHGAPIFDRMENAAEDCPIPDTLLDPYASESSDEV